MVCTNYKLISFKQAVSQIVQTQHKFLIIGGSHIKELKWTRCVSYYILLHIESFVNLPSRYVVILNLFMLDRRSQIKKIEYWILYVFNILPSASAPQLTTPRQCQVWCDDWEQYEAIWSIVALITFRSRPGPLHHKFTITIKAPYNSWLLCISAV